MVSQEDKSLVLIGFMGAGKTTVGKLVAEKLGRRFIDSDEEIEKEYQMPITEIFKKYGEKEFREREKSFITEVCSHPHRVVSLGGGAFLQEEIRMACLADCMVIFLDISFEAWKRRIGLLMDTRPVLQGKSLDEMEELFYTRRQIYQTYHHIKLQTDHLDAGQAAESIVDLVQSGSGLAEC